MLIAPTGSARALRTLLATGLLCWCWLDQQVLAQETRAFAYLPVYSQPAADLVGVLRPMVGGGTLVAHRDQLIVHGTPREIAAVTDALARLDRAKRRLMVEVRFAERSALQGRPSSRDAAPADGGGRSLSTQRAQNLVQQVQTLDGEPAMIRTGEWRPVNTLLGVWARQGAVVVGRDVQATESGFYALPRTHGDEVTVELYQQHEAPMRNGGLRSASTQTRVRGPLGEWLDVGAEQRREMPGTRGWSTADQSARYLQLRVRALD